MSSSVYGRKLNFYQKAKELLGIKGVRQSIVITNNPPTFPNLGVNDVIVPESVKLAFTIAPTSTATSSRTIVNNSRALVKKTTLKISGNEVVSIDDSDVFQCYMDLWKSGKGWSNALYQGINFSANKNVTLLRIGATYGDDGIAADKAVADTYGNRFFIHLDFELLESHMPFYQLALGDRLEVLCHCKMIVNASHTLWNVNLNVPARSMKGFLMLFEDPAAAFLRNSEAFYNPKIQKVEVTIEGVPNQLYSQGLCPHQI
ncbi:hypothetical protein CAPTEDRAFT_197725 [Capitella teleta]|uniref:Uncharacterized protein n=1 Tax=Capitella teleta TaxID=283909 RepID=R7TYR6_CAPTE|nr:hypothetical protein CAPTEDRAFT_197725 [Capitella teleta]|eukprot:ELT99068.1 hypothetical protein CAPTEDRAFT_197725 [Capitella teleta]